MRHRHKRNEMEHPHMHAGPRSGFGGRHRGRRGRQGGEWGTERGGRGRSRVFDSGELRLVLLKLIAEAPRHGYDLIRAIEELTGGGYTPSPGVVYPALSVLQDLGHIEEAESEGARKAFAATPEGIAELEANAEKVESLFARLAALAEKREHIDAAPVRRAIDNLRTVLRDRLGSDEADKDMVHKAAAILDEAAQKIERLP